MLNKKLMILTIILISILAVSAVSAEENATDDTIVVDEINSENTLKISEEEIVSSTRTVSGNTFSDIQSTIDLASDKDTIELSGTYTGSNEIVIYSKSLTIVGKNDATLNANDNTEIFKIVDSDVTFKNMKFINAKDSSTDGRGSAVSSTGGYTSIINCNFINCKSIGDYGEGGALYGCVATNSIFENCEAFTGGAMKYGQARNCTFNNCKAKYGGATYETFAEDCKFDKTCSATQGSSMYKGTAKNCEFGSSYYETEIINNGIIKITQDGKYYGQAKLVVQLIDEKTGNPLGDVELKIRINNNYEFHKTNSNGIISYVPSLNPGNYMIEVDSYDESVSVNPTSFNNFNVEKVPANLIPTKLSTTYASGKNFQVKLTTSDNNPLSGIKLNFKIYTGTKYKNVAATTDSKGIAKYNTQSLAVGTHKVVVSLKDSSKCSASQKTSQIKITKAGVSIKAYKTGFNDKKKIVTYTIYAKNKASGKAISGLKVYVKVFTGKKYKTISATTNKNGVVIVKTNSLTKGSHKVIITTNANANYAAGNAKSSIVIGKRTSTSISYFIVAYSASGNEINSISVDLKDSKGNQLIKPVKIIQTGGKTFNGVSSKDRTSSVAVNMVRPATFKLYFAGDDQYKPSSRTYTI